MRKEFVSNQQSQKIAEFLGDMLDVAWRRHRRHDGIENAGNAFKFGEGSGMNRALCRCFKADLAFGEIALGEACEAGAKLCRLGAQPSVLGWCDTHGHDVRARGLLIRAWPCHCCLLTLFGFGRSAPDREGVRGNERSGFPGLSGIWNSNPERISIPNPHLATLLRLSLNASLMG